ncbi:hemerythrin domain-containing protein [Streptomyces goshikiensis]|uniref:hemerythrin domain-containing protein n=1 Tax=Streptomyces goshikiensis TaxID=1942 RepID=UPI0033DE84ED
MKTKTTKKTQQTQTGTRPDTHQMVVIHRGIRREAGLLIDLVTATAPGDTARAKVLAEHFRTYRLGLHNHHTGEDEHLWPALLARVDLEADIVLRMEEQHERVAATLAAADAALPAWEATAAEPDRDRLAAVLAEHRAVLVEHLDEEEESLLPLADRHLTAQEWAAMGEHFAASAPKPKVLFFLGMALEEADRAERRSMLRGLPLPARLIWYAVGRPAYARTVRAVRRTGR